ncbi:MAG: GNAT family N-acetyltransferase [Polyangiales bacterium]
MTILNVADPLMPVHDDAISGAAHMLSLLDEGLDRAGHRSIMIAPAGSVAARTLIAMPPCHEHASDTERRTVQRAYQRAIDWALDHEAIDVVHFHGTDFQAYLPAPTNVRPNMPTLLGTLHADAEQYAPEIFEGVHDDLLLQCVSESYTGQYPAQQPLLAAVPYGVAVGRLRPARRKREFALAIGRIAPETGFDRALAAALRADIALLLAGPVEDEAYFAGYIAGSLDRRRRFLGPVSFLRRRRLMAAARCLVLPSLGREVSSLLAMEAIACGTPVVAPRTAAMAEIVEQGRTGILFDDPAQLAAAMNEAGELSTTLCRSEGQRRFSVDDMVKRYLALYGRIRTQRGSVSRVSTIPIAPLQPRELTTVEQLASLEPAWSELLRACPNATPFEGPAWLLPWCKEWKVRELRTLAIYRGSQLVGLVPQRLCRDQPARVLTLLGGSASDYRDVLVHPAHTRGVLACYRDWLWTQRAEWDYCDFEQLPAQSPLLQLDLSTLGAAHSAVQEACPVLELRATLKDTLPARLQKGLAQAHTALAQRGRLGYEVANPSSLDALMDGLIALHDKRQLERDKPGLFQEAHVAAFHRTAARRLLEAGALRMYALRLDGQLLAVFYGFADTQRVYYYLGAFDATWSKYSPGALVLAYAIEQAIADGAKELDFLRGAEPYKYAWGAEDTFTHRYTLVQAFERRSSGSRRAISR